MKFLKENWYKLMTGTAMLIFACGFFIYAVSPSYANQTSEVNKPQMKEYEDLCLIESNGYIYAWPDNHSFINWIDQRSPLFDPAIKKLPSPN